TAIACVALASALYGAGALAGGWGHGHHHHRGPGHHHKGHGSSIELYIGAPLPRLSWWYSPPHYHTHSRTIVVERQPEVYVQRTVSPAPAQQEYWYYCPDSGTYYPYVQTCPSPWLQVVPQTAP